MIIGIDGNEANVTRRVGIGEYAFELLSQFNQISNHSTRPYLTFQIYLKNKPMEHMPKESKNWKYKIFGPSKLWTQFALPIELLIGRPKPDVFFTPSHYGPRFTLLPTAISVMDLSYIHFPDLFAKKDLYQLVNWTKYSAKQAQRIFTISEASKNDIINYYGVDQEKILVTYPGIKQKSRTMNQVPSIATSLPKKYILFVGTLQPRKNIGRLIESFSTIAKKHPELHLVVVGKKGWLYESILSSPEKYAITNKVHFMGEM